MLDEVVAVVGLGEVGRPLISILSRSYRCIGIDIEPAEIVPACSVMHICIPFQVPMFVDTTCEYITKYKPRYTVINSTVAPGTTRAVSIQSGVSVAYSPVRGKHAKMEPDMLRYKKFVAADDERVMDAVIKHFAGAGFSTDQFPSPEIGELAKLLETTWLGVLVAWAQEVERIAGQFGATYSDVNAFIEEIDFLPRIFPGVIGGHCVMPNIAILRSQLRSEFLDLIAEGNEAKSRRMASLKETSGA